MPSRKSSPGVLAHRLGVADVIDRVVDQLEGDAEVAPVRLEARLDRRRPLGDDGGDLARGGKQHRGLGGDDFEVAILGGVDVALRGQLGDLAFRDHRRCARQDAEDLQRPVLDHQLEGAAEQEVADQHARRVAPDGVRRRLAASQVGTVDDVVVQQCRGMDELDRRRQPVMPLAAIVEQPRASERQHRPQPLAAAGDQVAGKLGNQGDRRLHPVKDDVIDRAEVGATQIEQRGQRRSRRGPRTQRQDARRHGFPYTAVQHRDKPGLAGRTIGRDSKASLRWAAARPEETIMTDATLHEFRESIDNIDAALVFLLAERFKVTQKVGTYKATAGLAPADPGREAAQIARLRVLAAQAKLDPEFSEKFLRFIIDEVIRHHEAASS